MTKPKRQSRVKRKRISPKLEFDIRLHALSKLFSYPISHKNCGICGKTREECKHL